MSCAAVAAVSLAYLPLRGHAVSTNNAMTMLFAAEASALALVWLALRARSPRRALLVCLAGAHLVILASQVAWDPDAAPYGPLTWVSNARNAATYLSAFLLPGFVAGAVLGISIANGVRARSRPAHDSFDRGLSAAGLSLVVIGALAAWFDSAFAGFDRKTDAWLVGNAIALVGVIGLAGSAARHLARRRWLGRLRASAVAGWRMLPRDSASDPGVLPFVAARGPALADATPDGLIVKHESSGAGPFRGQQSERAVAAVWLDSSVALNILRNRALRDAGVALIGIVALAIVNALVSN